MPIWKVSLTDGTFQVADADGVLYPLTTAGAPITQFNQGWSPRGLQTGLPPLHILELEHAEGGSTIWLHDETLDYRANTVLGLGTEDQTRFFAVVDPIVRTLYAECVLAPQAAIPAAAHQFDGMLPETINLLLRDSVNRTMPALEVVVLDRLQELGAGYGSGANALSADWIARSIEAPAAEAQEGFDLPGLRCQRHRDEATGRVFYVMRSSDADETSLYVPSVGVVVARGRHTHDPRSLLLQYYAGNTNRVVSLPEMFDLPPELVAAPPQHGLDEPPETDLPYPAPVAADAPPEPAHESGRTVFEAPLSETPTVQETSSHETIVQATEAYDAPHAEPPHRDAHGYGTPGSAVGANPSTADQLDAGSGLAHMTRPPVPAAPLMQPDARRQDAAAPKQNWWQRLLGLGNP